MEQARERCQNAAKLFGVAMGRVWSCQLAFDSTQFDKLILWLEEHRGGLNILVHGVTGNDREDHTANASWLGEPAKLNLSVFDG